MKRNEHTILKRNIPDVNLHSLTGQYWFETESNSWESWVSGSISIPGMKPDVETLVHDIRWYPDITYDKNEVLFHSGKTYNSLVKPNLNHIPSEISSSYWKSIEQTAINTSKGKYYKWNGTQWVLYTDALGYDYNLPVFLESSVDEMGVMVSFADSNGDELILQTQQLCNFTYTTSGNTLTLFNSVNPDRLRKIVDQVYTITWGDGTTNGYITVSTGSTLNSTGHTYSSGGTYNVSISLDSPWTKDKVTKIIKIPSNSTSISDEFGTFTYTGMSLPYIDNTSHYYLSGSHSQKYISNIDYTNNTGYTPTGFTYIAIGGSRIGELKKYGETTLSTSSYTTGTFSGSAFTGYTFTTGSDTLHYMDFVDGYTMITGNTSGFTREEVFNNAITRNEHFLGFIDDPQVYSDIFVERGKQGVMESNLRLGEIDNMGEMEIYGNGFFKVRKQ
jgi:hypothetical protein